MGSTLALLLASLLTRMDDPRGPLGRPGVLLVEHVFEDPPTPQCHAATLAEAERGLVAAWFGGTRERHPDVGIWLARRERGTWSSPELVADGVQHAELRHPSWNPVLHQVQGGPLLLFYPAVIQTRDGTVHVVYTWRRERIRHVALDAGALELRDMPDGAWPK